jgi:hypothetical protein
MNCVKKHMKHFKKIISYGCSLTAGSELMDHIHMKMSFDECNAIKHSYIKRKFTIENMSRFEEDYKISQVSELNRQSSWAGQLAKMLNIPFENRADAGSSIDQIYFKLYNDYNNSNILSTDLVLVGLPPIPRIIKFTEHHINSIIIGHHVDNKSIEYFNNDFLFFQYFKTLRLLLELDILINIRLQPMVCDINPNTQSCILIHVNGYIQSTWNKLQDVLILPEEYLQVYLENGRPKRCGFNHEPVESHIELAKKIFEQVKF